MASMLKLAAVTMFALAAVAPGSSVASHGLPPTAGSCSAECDRKAAECVDACDAAHKEAKARVECKLTCIADREKCEKGCDQPSGRAVH
jgi:hypothetical protein